MRCLLVGHRAVEVAATPDAARCRAANQPALMPGQPVVICKECGQELHVGSLHDYLDQAPDEQPERAFH